MISKPYAKSLRSRLAFYVYRFAQKTFLLSFPFVINGFVNSNEQGQIEQSTQKEIFKLKHSPVLEQKLKQSNSEKGTSYKPHTKHIDQNGKPLFINRLILEQSPYLLQHAHNPVDWYSWGNEAFSAAQKENKIIFLSIGYSTCYWCHVMENDSFENLDVAEFLNNNFVCIKVDREELPDVDQIYMDAVVAMTSRGGWPLSVFLTSDLKPFFGGTYFPHDQFLSILSRIQDVWKNEPEKIVESGNRLTTAISQDQYSQTSIPLNEDVFRKFFKEIKERFDSEDGGFTSAPKFPPSNVLSLLFRIHRRTGNKESLEMATSTLEKMLRGGIFDQLSGGFHRYSTDKNWLIPHFEKMLYDNALLATTYLEGYQITNQPMFRETARSTLDFVLNEMTTREGGFASALDAGEVGQEGEYYVWKSVDVEKILSKEEYREFAKAYGVTPMGNFEGETNVLHLPSSLEWEFVQSKNILSAREKLLDARKLRLYPHKDDKILTSWNGLMIGAMAKGYQVLRDKKYLDAATKSAQFIKNHLEIDGELLRRYRDGESKYKATIEDYAYLIFGLLTLYETDFNSYWLTWAEELQTKQNKLFWDDQSKGYFFAQADDNSLIIRKKETYDGATPSANSVSAINLLRLYDLTYRDEYLQKANELFVWLSTDVNQLPTAYSQFLIALDYRLDFSKEIAVVGKANDPNVQNFIKYIHQSFFPNKVIAFGSPENISESNSIPLLLGKTPVSGKAGIYVCEEQTCNQPTDQMEIAKKCIEEVKEYKL